MFYVFSFYGQYISLYIYGLYSNYLKKKRPVTISMKKTIINSKLFSPLDLMNCIECFYIEKET